MNLEGGEIYVLNAAAAQIWAQHLEGVSLDQIIEWAQVNLRLARKDARKACESTLGHHGLGFQDARTLQHEETGYGFSRTGSGDRFKFEFLSHPLFEFDTTSLRVMPLGDLTGTEWERHLWSLSPNLLAILGVSTLHASAVDTRKGTMLFCGPSGAGKTTTAEAWARSDGSRLLCEDKAVLTFSEGAPELAHDGEQRIREWISSAKEPLERCSPADARGLTRATEGPKSRVKSVGFLDRSQRLEGLAGMVISEEAPQDSLAMLLRQTFTGAGDSTDWRSRFEWAAALTNQSSVQRLYVPNNTPQLELAIASEAGAEN